MSITDTDKIDFASLDGASEDFMLTISDHLDWNKPEEHLLALQSKLNTYIDFVESGEIYSQWPLAVGRVVKFRVIGKYPLSDAAREFYFAAEKAITNLGLSLTFELLDEG